MEYANYSAGLISQSFWFVEMKKVIKQIDDGKSEEEIKNVIQQIKDTGIHYVCTGHCTKSRAYKILENGLGNIVHQLNVGLQIEI